MGGVRNIADTIIRPEFEISITKAFTSQQPPLSPFLKISLAISCAGVIKISVSNTVRDSGVFLKEKIIPSLEATLTLPLPQYQRREETLAIVAKKTKRWPISDQVRSDLVDKAFRRVTEEVNSMQGVDNHVTIRAHVSITRHSRLVRQSNRFMDLTPGAMVPAHERAIESLETKVLKSGRCCICLEGLAGYGGTVIRCSHAFHRDCIQRWLRNSNLCPLCRYPMPGYATLYV